jgi:hypothetical protein
VRWHGPHSTLARKCSILDEKSFVGTVKTTEVVHWRVVCYRCLYTSDQPRLVAIEVIFSPCSLIQCSPVL